MSAPADSLAPVRVESLRLRRSMALAAAVTIGLSVVGAAFSPYLLIHHPALLLTLAPEPRHVVLTASLLPGWVIVTITTVRRVIGLVTLFGVGWAYGQGALVFIEERFGKMGKLLRWVERSLSRHGALLVLALPMPSICAMAGVAGTPFAWTLVAMTLGQTFWVGVTWAFGDLISAFTTPLVELLSLHVVEATAICVLVVVVWQIRSQLASRGRSEADEEE